METAIVYEDADHSWVALGRDPSKPERVIDTNQYLIRSGEESMMLDPGGTEIFPEVLSQVAQFVDVRKLGHFLCSHQDPDVMSSLPLWMNLNPSAKVYVSWLWSRFVSHFSHEHSDRFVDVPDEGMEIRLGGRVLTLVPAHHCHSAGNFHLYDPTARILFSGDVGAALVPPDAPLFVEDFDPHVRYMEAFHRRWMPSDAAKEAWIRRVRRLPIDYMCPQHGSIFQGEQVSRFLDWFSDLRVGALAA